MCPWKAAKVNKPALSLESEALRAELQAYQQASASTLTSFVMLLITIIISSMIWNIIVFLHVIMVE